MIHEVRIKNILSFREEQIFSFEATADKSFEDLYTVQIKPNLKLLKLGILYGANASGKTNFLVALNFLRNLVLEAKEDKFKTIDFIPFLLDHESKKQNGSFYISFFIGSIRYIYTLELNSKFIVQEKLLYYPKTQPALVFNRVFNQQEEIATIEFGDKLNLTSKETIILEGNAIKNATLLSIYNKLNINIETLELVVQWFKKNFMEIVKPKTNLTNWAIQEVERSKKYKDFLIDILQKADFNISDIIIEEKEEIIDDDLAELIKDTSRISTTEKERLLNERKLKLKSISFLHRTNLGDFKIPMNLQSNGTARYFGLGGILNTLLEKDRLLTIDELETSLHYELVSHFLKTFLVNSNQSQLIVATHNINILMADFIRRDVIWFCEKNEEGATKLFSASDFKIHKNISLFNAYKIGKLGAKPNLGNIYLKPHG